MGPYAECKLCPRACGVDRTAAGSARNGLGATPSEKGGSSARVARGVCGASDVVRIGRAALHWWEEPCLVGEQGSGAVFFAYCPLQCVYCQNRVLVEGSGIDVTDEELAALFLRLQNEEHAANINLVTPTHYVPTIARVLRELCGTEVSIPSASAEAIEPDTSSVSAAPAASIASSASGALHIPVVYNTSSYETPETLRLMDGLVDVYLADFKYATPDVARRLSHAPDYPEVALAAIDEMLRQVPMWQDAVPNTTQSSSEASQNCNDYRHVNENGVFEDDTECETNLAAEAPVLLQRGVIVRHLVLPGYIEESKRALEVLAERYGNRIRLSIMNQYTPLAPGLERYGLIGTVTPEEYEEVLDCADELGIQDYFWQEGGAAEESFVPAFDGTGVPN